MPAKSFFMTFSGHFVHCNHPGNGPVDYSYGYGYSLKPAIWFAV